MEIEIAVFTDDLLLGHSVTEQFPDAEYELNAAVGGTTDVVSLIVDSAALAVSIVSLLYQIRAKPAKTVTINHITITAKGRTQRIVVSSLGEAETVAALHAALDEKRA